MMELYMLLQEPVTLVMPELFKYGIGGLLAAIGFGYGWIERSERVKIQEEKNKLYDERNNTQAQLEKILKELQELNHE